MEMYETEIGTSTHSCHRHHDFFGRSNELNIIKEYVLNHALDSQNSAVQIIHVTGPPAIGKTQLAKQTIHEIKSEFMQGIWCPGQDLAFNSHFLDLHKESKISNVFKLIGLELGCSVQNGRQLIRSLTSRLSFNTFELLVLDGIDELLLDEESGGQLLQFCQDAISESSHVKLFLLVTSAVKFQLPRCHSKHRVICLHPLSVIESRDALLRIASPQQLDSYLDSLAEYSVGFPLAISLIGALVKDGHVSPKELTEKLRRDWIATLINGDSKSLMQRLRNVFKVCLESLPLGLRENYAKLVYIPASFTAEAASHMTSASTHSTAVVKQDIILPLYDRSLVEIYHLQDPTTQTQRFQVHQILRSFVEDRYHLLDHELHEVRNRYCVFYGQLLLKISPMLEKDFATHLPIFTIEIRNIEKLLREAIHCLEDNTNLFLKVAYDSHMFIETFLPTVEAVEFYKACVNAAQGRRLIGGRYSELSEARMLLVYGRMLGAAKTDFELEYEQYMKSMKLLNSFGDNIEMATLLYCIAGNLHSRGKRFEAIKKLQESLDVLERLETPCLQSTATPGPSIKGSKHQGNDKNVHVELHIREQIQLNRGRVRANVTYLLGVIYAWIGETTKAEKYHQDSLGMKRALWGENHPSVGVGYNGLSLLYEKLGDPNRAAHFCFLGLDIKQKFFKEPTTGVIVSLNNSARHLSQQKGQHEKALELLDKAYNMRKKLGLNHRDTSLIYQNRGKVYTWMGNWSEASVNFERAVELRKEYIGTHASTASSMYLLGKSYLNAGQHLKAIDPLSECLKMREAVHMTEQPFSDERANTLEPLAEAYCGIGDTFKAIEFYERTMTEVIRLADGYTIQGDIEKASKFVGRFESLQQKLDELKSERDGDSIQGGVIHEMSFRLLCFSAICTISLLWFWYNFDLLYHLM